MAATWETITSAGALRDATITSPSPEPGEKKPALARLPNPKTAKKTKQTIVARRRARRAPERPGRPEACTLRCQ